MDYREYLESRSDVMLGKPVIKGTRITVELILRMLSEGASVADIIAAYPHLQAIHISAVLAYASDVIANETLIPAA
jgi:uncharacterized protein (DUF433 family)